MGQSAFYISNRLRHTHDDSMQGLLNEAADEIDRLRASLHRISLGAQSSACSKETLGEEARKTLEQKPNS